MSVSSADYRRVAVRYAQALFGLASEQKRLDAVKKDFDAIATAYADSADFRRLLESPAIDSDAKGKALQSLLAKADTLTKDFIRVLVENRRTPIVPFVVEEYARLLAESRNETTARVTVAHPLKPAQVKELEASLKKATGRSAVHVDVTEDATILGGVVIHVDGKMFDNSIATKINRLAREMKTQVQA